MLSTRRATHLLMKRTVNFSALNSIKLPVIASFQHRNFSRRVDSQGNIIPIHRETVMSPVKFLPQQFTVLQERFGKFHGEHTAGLKVFAPVINELVFVINTENVYAVTHQEAITKDNASIKANGVFYYKIIDAKKAAYGTSNLLRSLEYIVANNLREVMGTMDLDDLLRGREKINKELYKIIAPAAKEWGVEVTRVEINEISPDRNLVKAMDQQMIAERDRRATETAAEAKKKSTVLGAQAERERIENEANGRKEATLHDAEAKLQLAKKDAEGRKVLADADAYVRETLAKAEAKSIETVSQAISKHPEMQNYLIAKETVEAWKKLAASPNHKTLLFQTDPKNNIMAPLAAAAEMLKLGEDNVTASSLTKKN